MGEVITQVDQVTSAWLTTVLRKADLITSAEVQTIEVGEQKFARSTIYPLAITYSEPVSAPQQFILKLSNPEHISFEEVEFYQNAEAYTFPIVRCFSVERDANHFHLLLEDLSETHVASPPSQFPMSFSQAELVIDALAQLHAYWWDHADLEPSAHNNNFLHSDIARIDDFVEFLGDRLSPSRRAIYREVGEKFPAIYAARMNQNNLTRIHGDPHIGNFLYPKDPHRNIVRILDWKSWSTEVGPNDIAHMLGVFWFPERRQRFEQQLVQYYHASLKRYGVTDYSYEACWHDYRLAVIRHLFMPAWQWSHHGMVDVWWNHLERIMSAYVDLNCVELFRA